MTAMPPMDWAGASTRFVLFTGKGGVGKTTVASATAVALADAGQRVLLVSTDPASNLSDVFQMPTGELPSPVATVSGLDVMDLDPQEAADGYRARVIDPYRGVLPDGEVAALEEKLAGACTVEVAAFDTFARLLADPDSIGEYDHVLFDTAPTGHTLRLLSLPAAWSDYLGANPDATSCLGPLAGLQDDRPIYTSAVDVLSDGSRTTVVLVARPDRGALTVAATAARELQELGIANQTLVINGLLVDPSAGDTVAAAYAAAQRQALAAIPPPLDALAAAVVPLVAIDMVGVEALRRLVRGGPRLPGIDALPTNDEPLGIGSFGSLVDELEQAGHGVALITGKGGVGKTTVARMVAVELARRGHPVHLSTTDPAGHAALADVPGLTTSAIDPEEATRAYVQGRLDAASRSGLDEEHIELLAEDLRSPCSQEVAVFQAFRQLLGRARREFVVIDTAPTGHTLLLLDVTGSFHRQVVQDVGTKLRNVVTPLMRLQDPEFSRVLIVTLAETTPVAEAAELQDDLRRAGIEPFGWVVNATLAGSGTADRVLQARAGLERAQLKRIERVARRTWVLPWSPDL
ncbi:MAG: arsenical pump-driving ATPase [Acidimicrobiia bacterium]